MSWTVATVILALLVPALTRGSYARLLRTPWQWNGLLALGLGIQALLGVVDLPESRWHDVGFGLLVTSYVLLTVWCARNAVLRGMAVVLVGLALNAIAITANQGMPVDVPDSWARDLTVEPTLKHHPQGGDDRLLVITDIVPVPGPWPTMASFGDLILTIGLCDVAFHASRRRRPRGRGSTRTDHSTAMPPAGDEAQPAPSITAAEQPTNRRERATEVSVALAAYASTRSARDDALQRVEHARVVQIARR